MDLLQLMNGAQKHVSEAFVAFNNGEDAGARDSLAEAAGLIQREIGDKDEPEPKPEEKEETPQTTGHCQPDQTNEKGSE